MAREFSVEADSTDDHRWPSEDLLQPELLLLVDTAECLWIGSPDSPRSEAGSWYSADDFGLATEQRTEEHTTLASIDKVLQEAVANVHSDPAKAARCVEKATTAFWRRAELSALITPTDVVAEELPEVKTGSSLALEQSRQKYDSIACQPFIPSEILELYKQGQDDADRRAFIREVSLAF